MTPELSIVIPAYNVAPFISDAVRSALSQDHEDLEVVVVDDGSTDGTALRLAGVSDPRLRLIRRENGGLSAARNAGVRAARGAFIGFLDGDDLWRPDKARRHLERMRGDRDLVLTYSHAFYLDEAGRPTGRRLIAGAARPTARDLAVRNHVGNGSSPVVRADALGAAGPFDEDLRIGAEDYEMWVRLLCRTGGRAELIDDDLTGYRVRASSMTFDVRPFVKGCGQAVDALARRCPELPRSALRAGRAEHLRIASRKLASMGRRREAARLFARAAVLAPRRMLGTVRAHGTLLAILAGDATLDRVAARLGRLAPASLSPAAPRGTARR